MTKPHRAGRLRRRLAAIGAAALSMTLLFTAPAWAYDKTWNYSGDFKASLQSRSFENYKDEPIKISVKPTNCTPGYDHIYLELMRQTSLTIFKRFGPKLEYPCGVTSSYTWSDATKGTYRMYFSRTGPTGFDENLKHVEGTVYYW